ncbi:MAG TPA: LCP family protein [Euzebyales bacterium]|nr:LCP family protein [Euzebyales bacterium]
MDGPRTEGEGLSDFFDMRRDGGWLPAAGPPPRRRRIGAILRRVVTVVLCFAVGVALAVGALVWQGRHELMGTRIALDTLGQPPVSEGASEPQGLSKAQTVLVVGDDSGDDLSKQFRDLGTGDREGHRTDTIMVLRIDPQGNKITGINFPRDLLVTICDGSRQRINAAWYNGGADCLVETVRDVAGIRIDHYVQVNFEGFVKIVDAVGGVPMYLEKPMTDPKAHVDLPKGCVELDGRNALGFVRTRVDSDFGRIARQQRFLKELADRATSLSVLANPVRLFQLVDSIGELLTVDDSLGVGTMREFALTLRSVESDDITLGTIPTVTDSSTGVFYEIPVRSGTEDLLRAFKQGTLAQYLGEASADEPTESASPDPEPKIPADELAPVSMLNASNVTGLATNTADVLANAGVAIRTATDTVRPEPDGVVIAYPPGRLTEAQSLKVAAFPDAVLELDESVDAVSVILNRDVDPDLIDVAGVEQSEPARQKKVPPRPEYINADPDDQGKC